MDKQDFVYRCKECSKEFETKRDANNHALTHQGEERKTVIFELVDRDPSKRHPGIWRANIPTMEEMWTEVLRKLDRATLERIEHNPEYAEKINRRLEERQRAQSEMAKPEPPTTERPEGKPSESLPKRKTGPHRYSRKEKIEARKAWDDIDQEIYPIKLEVWLETRFGTTETGMLKVPLSTFYSWPKS